MFTIITGKLMSMHPRILVVLAEGFEETEAIATIDLLRRAEIEVIVEGLVGSRVKSAHQVVVETESTFSANEQVDGIVLPGGMPGTTNLLSSEPLLKFIAELHNAGKLCAAICAAPWVLAKAGILTGKKATCYPGIESQLPGAELRTDSVVVDGTIITSRGVGTVLDFGLAIIEYLKGAAEAQRIATTLLHCS